MPNFRIRRKKREPEPVPQKQEDQSTEEPSVPMQEDSVESEMSLEECFEDLNLKKRTEEYRPPPRRVVPRANYERHPPRPVQYPEPTTYAPRRYAPYPPRPSMRIPQRPPQKIGHRNKIVYSSHYGLNGEYLDTQTKASLLLRSCFG